MSRSISRLLPMVVLALITSGSTDARASAITYDFGGVVTSGDFATGTRFSGTFTYDPKDLAQGTMIEGDRNYVFGQIPGFPVPASTGVDGLTLSIGGQSIASTSGVLGVGLYQPEMGGYKAISGSPVQATYLNIGNAGGSVDNPINVSLALSNPNRTVYSSLDMPPAINLSDFTSAVLNVSSNQSGSSGIPTFAGTIDTLTPVPAPEPSTLVVLGVGLAAWLARSRSRSARRPS